MSADPRLVLPISIPQNNIVAALSSKINDVLIESFNNTTLQGWSRKDSSAGLHVEFGNSPRPDLKFVRELGGSNAVVVEVDCNGTRLAKKTYDPKRLGWLRSAKVIDMKTEITALKRLRHRHVIELVGSFTHNRGHPAEPVLEVLLWPVAACSLEKFCEAIEEVSDRQLSQRYDYSKESLRLLRTIVQLPDETEELEVATLLKRAIRRLYSSFGCLAEGLSYIHGQEMLHKDIKPSNILVYPNRKKLCESDEVETLDGIRITDFDGAKDFSRLGYSTTGDTFGTRTYLPPECTRGKRQCGRAADIFSLGCVYFELLMLLPHFYGRPDRRKYDLYYLSIQAISEQMDGVCNSDSLVMGELAWLIKNMLQNEPENRPIAREISLHLRLINDRLRLGSTDVDDLYSLFGRCCQGARVSPASGWVGTPSPWLPALPSLPNLPHTHWNKGNERVDAPVATVDPRFVTQVLKEKAGGVKVCDNHFLRGTCRFANNCEFSHDASLSQYDLELLRASKKRIPCKQKSECTDPLCIYGHNCPDYTRAQHCPRGSACSFNHDIDSDIAVSKYYYGITG